MSVRTVQSVVVQRGQDALKRFAIDRFPIQVEPTTHRAQ